MILSNRTGRPIRADAPIRLVEQQHAPVARSPRRSTSEDRAVLGVERAGEAARRRAAAGRARTRGPHAARAKQLVGEALVEIAHVADARGRRAARVQRALDRGLDGFAQPTSRRVPSFGRARCGGGGTSMTRKPAAAIAGLCRPLFRGDESDLTAGARWRCRRGGGSWVRADIFCNLSNCDDNGPVFCGRLPPAPLTRALAMLRLEVPSAGHESEQTSNPLHAEHRGSHRSRGEPGPVFFTGRPKAAQVVPT